jgi:murein DD-endopeptidase MepM/ murein hydrolase activator NlpD
MPQWLRRSLWIVILAVSLTAINFTFAAEDLNKEIADRKAQVDQINKRMEEYKKKISQYANQSASLANDLELIDNQLALLKLDLVATQKNIESQEIKIQILDEKIRGQSEKLDAEKKMLQEMVFSLHVRDNKVGFLAAVFGSDNFDELFSEVEYLESLNADLNDTLHETEATKQGLESDKTEQAQQLSDLQVMQDDLRSDQVELEQQLESKNVLLSATQSSEAQYRVLMSELRQEQSYITSQIVSLQHEIERKIAEADLSGDTSAITWPVTDPILTARFHDPSYPFRHLFEHSGLDMAIPVGTPIRASAPGYVAWARLGRSYGNYVMIIHSNGLATLYAHLSRIEVTEGQFVGRGEEIGRSGGAAGASGAGLSTGPHLHFEVRLNGIPVNPQAYLH